MSHESSPVAVTALTPLSVSASTPLPVVDGLGTVNWANAALVNLTTGAVICDTGALAAGDYEITVSVATDEGNTQKTVIFEHRNAANDATLKSLAIVAYNGPQQTYYLARRSIALNERLRVIAGTSPSTSRVYSATIIYRRIS